MDTRYWGPDGWKLLHSITNNYPENPSRYDILTHCCFFNLIGEVLPCKYCRMSYKKYIGELPVEKHLKSKKTLFKWLYLIHNKVNNKLRDQELLKYENPTLEEIEDKYSNEPFKEECLLGKHFLRGIVFNYPKNENTRLRHIYISFFNYVFELYPNKNKEMLIEFSNKYQICKNIGSDRTLKKWFYILSSYIEDNCDLIKPYNIFAKECEKYRSKGCSKPNHRGNTCRSHKVKLKD